jgi:hypothetical protein
LYVLKSYLAGKITLCAWTFLFLLSWGEGVFTPITNLDPRLPGYL